MKIKLLDSFSSFYWFYSIINSSVVRANEEVKVTATSKEVLFNPSTKTTVIQGTRFLQAIFLQ